MHTPLALLNLLHQKTRTLVAMAGVSFAIILIFLQLGFRGSAEATATVLYNRLGDFDVVLVSSKYRDMNRSETFPRQRLYQARDVKGVAEAYPVYVGFNLWRNPANHAIRRIIFIIGYNPDQHVFRTIPETEDPAVIAALKRPDTFLIDRQCHPDFGLVHGQMPDGIRFSEIGGIRVENVGYFDMGTGFASDGSVIVSDETFSHLLGGWPLDRVSLGMIRLEKGADIRQVCRDLRQTLPEDVTVLTRAELENRERGYWLTGKSIGVLFTTGVLVAFVVGVIFVYQIISTDIANQLPEYATLKAMGYDQRYLSTIVLQQATILGALSYVPGLLVSLLLYEVTRDYARVPIDMPVTRAVMVFLLAVAMCCVSGLFSLRKLRSADPADLF
jgi:putative ABC transport system permease protein